MTASITWDETQTQVYNYLEYPSMENTANKCAFDPEILAWHYQVKGNTIKERRVMNYTVSHAIISALGWQQNDA